MSSDKPSVELADEVVEANAPEDGVEDEAADGEPRTARWVLLGSAAFALAALLAAAVFGVQWWISSSNDNAGLAAVREDVVRVGGVAVKAYTEVDYTDLDGFFNRQKAVSDPAMRDQLTQLEPTYRKALSDAKTKVATTIQDIAVEELNDHEGKASFLAAITTKVSQGDQSSVKALRLEIQMTRIEENGDQVWKLSGIDNVPLVAAGR
jgi:Mce-associated membrane protein